VTAVAECVDGRAEPRTGGNEAIANMRGIDAPCEGVERGVPVDLARVRIGSRSVRRLDWDR
jgi:hypothetical protein